MPTDIKFAFRQLLKSPGFTAVAIVTLAIAIGVNTAIFSLVNGVLLRPTVDHSHGEIAEIYTGRQKADRDYRQFSHREFEALREPGEIFDDIEAVTFSLVGIGRDNSLRRSFAFSVSSGYFGIFGASPAAGRFFSAAECRPNAEIAVAVSSWNLWQRYGGKSDFIGSTLRINDRLFTIIGVTPKGFSNGNALIAPEVWLPLGTFSTVAKTFSNNAAVTDLNHPDNFTLNLVGRLKSGLTSAAAANRLPALAARINQLHPEEASGPRELQLQAPARFSISTAPSSESGLGMISVLLLSMAGAVLLIACLNLANMLLARGTARSREIAIRLALGATRTQVVRQLLVEGLLLAVVGGLAGLLISLWSGDLLTQSLTTLFNSMNFAYVVDLRPDLTVTGVTFVFCLVATLIFSLGPALRATQVDLVNDLKQQTGEPALLGRLNRFFAPRHILVMAQIAISLMLLFSAGLFFRAALKAGGLDLGFKPAGSVIAEIDYGLINTDPLVASRLIQSEIEQVRNLPGVARVGLATREPFSNTTSSRKIMRADQPLDTGEGQASNAFQGIMASITPGYLEALGVRMLRGRDFTDIEAFEKGAPGVCIVDEAMAKSLFPDGDALGQRVKYTQPPTDGSPVEMEIVGIVSDHRHGVLEQGRASLHLYLPLAQNFEPGGMIHVRLGDEDPARVMGFLP
ncbi:MAG: ABC transporter permease, partial [Cephaloticoccus sp.]|nr:ABC transporter permease [Cephaloticoccus sp.]